MKGLWIFVYEYPLDTFDSPLNRRFKCFTALGTETSDNLRPISPISLTLFKFHYLYSLPCITSKFISFH